MVNGINKDGIEIERKFLLKNIADEIFSKSFKKEACEIYYKKIDEQWVRVTKIIENDNIENLIYIQTIKTFISKGVFREREKYLTPEEFEDFKLSANRKITKTRYFCNYTDYVWEIDVFHNIKLVLAEVELISIDEFIKIPGFINEHLIQEVTGNENFLNVNLAINM